MRMFALADVDADLNTDFSTKNPHMRMQNFTKVFRFLHSYVKLDMDFCITA